MQRIKVSDVDRRAKEKSESAYRTRLQLRSAEAIARNFALATADERRFDAVMAADAMARAIIAMKDAGASKNWASDAAKYALDQLSDIKASIDRALDEQGLQASEPLDLGELTELAGGK